MKLYHNTFASEAILTEGFQDAEGNYLTHNVHRGVWFSNVRLDENEGADGDVLLVVDTGDTDLDDFEWVEEGKPYREWLVPAAIANEWPLEIYADDHQFDGG